MGRRKHKQDARAPSSSRPAGASVSFSPRSDDQNGAASPLIPPTPQLTRRALLALVGSVAISQTGTIQTEAGASGQAPQGAIDPVDPVATLWQQLLEALAGREHALAARDRIEAELLQTVGYPRVQLPAHAGEPARFAAEAADIDRALAPGQHRLRRRLKQELQQAQLAWNQAADAAGFNAALETEHTAFAAVRARGDTLLGSPATSLAGIRYKLAAIIAMGQSGQPEEMSFPWLPLRRTLDDLARLT